MHGDRQERRNATMAMHQDLRLPVAARLTIRPAEEPSLVATRRMRRVFDAEGRELLPGKLVLEERRSDLTTDVHAVEAFHACGATYDFLARVFLRNSIDNRGMAIESTVHFGQRYANACWNGRQMIFGDGDGRLFGRFTGAVDVVAHELMHGVVQHSARLPYFGQSGAVSEHLADAFGIMAKQFTVGEAAVQSDWLIGPGLFAARVRGRAIRSMLHPGSAYDDPVLGRDPQPAHMDAYADTAEDNGGVHINSGILNRAFALAARELGGYTWTVLGRIWYRVLTASLMADTSFRSFARDTVAAAGELYGRGSRVQEIVAGAWAAVGLPAPVPARSRVSLPHRITTRSNH